MHDSDKLHKKYLDEKRFLINKIFYEIFQRDGNKIKKILANIKTDYFNHSFIQDLNDMKKNMEENHANNKC